MMTAPDHAGCSAKPLRPLAQLLDLADHQPGPRQIAPVDAADGAIVGQDIRFPFQQHVAAFDILQIGAEKLQAMGGMAHQIALDQNIGDDPGAVVRHAGPGEQVEGEFPQIVGPPARALFIAVSGHGSHMRIHRAARRRQFALQHATACGLGDIEGPVIRPAIGDIGRGQPLAGADTVDRLAER